MRIEECSTTWSSIPTKKLEEDELLMVYFIDKEDLIIPLNYTKADFDILFLMGSYLIKKLELSNDQKKMLVVSLGYLLVSIIKYIPEIDVIIRKKPMDIWNSSTIEEIINTEIIFIYLDHKQFLMFLSVLSDIIHYKIIDFSVVVGSVIIGTKPGMEIDEEAEKILEEFRVLDTIRYVMTEGMQVGVFIKQDEIVITDKHSIKSFDIRYGIENLSVLGNKKARQEFVSFLESHRRKADE